MEALRTANIFVAPIPRTKGRTVCGGCITVLLLPLSLLGYSFGWWHGYFAQNRGAIEMTVMPSC